MRRGRMSAMSCGVVLAVLGSGCAGQSGDPLVDRAHHFYTAIAAEDGAAACGDLAPEARDTVERQEGKPCDEAILGLDLPTAPWSVSGDGTGPTVHVYGSMAQVDYPGEAAFLSRYGDDWLLTAAGCPPVSGDRPHECEVEVG